MEKSDVALVLALTVVIAAAQQRFCMAQEASPPPVAFHEVHEVVASAQRPDAVGIPVKMMAHVVHVSALRENTCVVASIEKPWEEGVVVKVPDSRAFAPGDVLLVEGTTVADGRALGVRADRAQRLRKAELPPPIGAKFADLRLGKLRTRRIAICGEITDIFVDNAPNGRVQTHFRVAFEHSRATCRVPGRLPSRYAHVGEVRVTGCVFDDLNAEGALVDSVVELEGQSSIEVLSSVYWWRVGVVFLAVVAAVLLVILLVALFRMRRRRITDRAVAVERQRMAADLHDTIEQHLAGVKILLTCAMKPEGVPQETKKVLEQAAAMLIHAKGEVRSTVMNLRSAGDDKSLAEHFQEIAASLRRSGLSVKVLLRGMPDRMDAARLSDLLLIAREAVTNAVKHGKAKTVLIVSDPKPDAEGFVLKILNDGAPFDAANALGPEMGHFGLAGMKDRASRSGFALDFLVDGKWTVVKVEVPK